MKKFISLLFAALMLTLTLISCTKASPEVSPAPDVTPSAEVPATTTPDVTAPEVSAPESETPPASDALPLGDDLMYSQTFDISADIKLYAKARYPNVGDAVINTYYSEQLSSFEETAESIVSDFADMDGDSFVTQYELDESYEIIYNTTDVFSVLRSVYQYTGGAHGYAFAVCDNFFREDGGTMKPLTLDDIFNVGAEEYMSAICAVFDAFIDEDNMNSAEGYGFFSSAKVDLREMFPSASFCVTDNGLIFYLPPYFVTPYASGTVIIPVSWESIGLVQQLFTDR